jgi:uncharacterized membrane-anchored protein YitT (DUF2179 family)
MATHPHQTPATKHQLRRSFGEAMLLALGVLSAGFGLKGFLLPNRFIDGGVMGISLLVAAVTNLPLPILVFVINLPFILLGLKQISKEFALKTFVGISALALVLALINYPVVTNDKVLTAVFGGFFLGLGVGLSVRGGGVIDGTEVLALYISKRTPFSIGDVILVFNIIIFTTAALVFGIETALYSIVTYLAASRTVDFVVQGIEEYTGVTIVSKHSEEIREAIIEQLGRGVTAYKGHKGFGKRGHTQDVDIIYTVVTRLEIMKLKDLIMSIDDSAFVVQTSINDTIGGMVKKRPLK